MSMTKYKTMVEIAMLSDPVTRDDDSVLYATICAELNPLTTSMDLATVLRNHERFGLPSFESITRARRKVQADNPSLRPSPKATKARLRKWEEVVEWAATE